jgi:uncharacterized protein DUF1016
MQLPGILLADIKSIFQQARQKAYAAVNTAMIQAYWKIGQRVVEKEQQGKERAGYGGSFSIDNLWNFRSLALMAFGTYEQGSFSLLLSKF